MLADLRNAKTKLVWKNSKWETANKEKLLNNYQNPQFLGLNS